MRASGVNFAETRMHAGTYAGQELPFVMGMEAAGVVAALGEGVTGFEPGQRVFGRARGAHAEYVLFDARHLMLLPERLSFEEGAAIPVGWLTAWHALHTVADTRRGQRVLIEAVASSVGSAALQIARRQGCWVAGTASRDEKVRRALAEGADAAYNYKFEDVAAQALADTAGAGIDVGLMTIGEETAQSLFDAMGQEGHIVMYGSTGGRQVCFNLNIGIRNLRLSSMSISTSPQFLDRDHDVVPGDRAAALCGRDVPCGGGHGAADDRPRPRARDDRRAVALREDRAGDRRLARARRRTTPRRSSGCPARLKRPDRVLVSAARLATESDRQGSIGHAPVRYFPAARVS